MSTPNLTKIDYDYIKAFPKVELHAHLYGSLSDSTLIRLHGLKYGVDSATRDSDLFHYTDNSEPFSLKACFNKFKIANDLIDNPVALAIAAAEAIRSFEDDNVLYLELRTTPKQTQYMTKVQYLDTILAAISNATGKCEIMVKLLVSIDRSKPPYDAMENVTLAGTFRKTYPDIVLGIDFSGNPECGDFETFKDALSVAKKFNLKLAVHCGEIEGKDTEISDMLKFGIDRIGHGTFITGDNLNYVYYHRIPIECCVTSNLLCRTVKTIEEHPFFNHFKRNHPVCICTDDFGVFNTTLSKEISMCSTTIDDIFKMTLNAILAAFCSTRESGTLQAKLNEHRRLSIAKNQLNDGLEFSLSDDDGIEDRDSDTLNGDI